MKPLKVLEAASTEYQEALDWYRNRDPRVAARFAAEVRRNLDLIRDFPHIGGPLPVISDSAIRRIPVHEFPYHIIFLDAGSHTEVVAFAHNRRRPTYFLRRLRR